MTFHASGLERRRSRGASSLSRALQRFLSAHVGGVSFIGPSQEDEELARLERMAREALEGRSTGR